MSGNEKIQGVGNSKLTLGLLRRDLEPLKKQPYTTEKGITIENYYTN